MTELYRVETLGNGECATMTLDEAEAPTAVDAHVVTEYPAETVGVAA